MKKVIDRIITLKGSQNTASFARSIGINQQTMDRYLKGREPPIGVIQQLCSTYGVSADWLLGLNESCCHGGNNSSPVPEKAVESGVKTSSAGSLNAAEKGVDCATCKYRLFAEAFKALQSPV